MSFIVVTDLLVTDALLQPMSEAGHMNELINEILVQIGLIKVCSDTSPLG